MKCKSIRYIYIKDIKRLYVFTLIMAVMFDMYLELTCIVFSDLADKFRENISSLKSIQKFSIMIKNARIFVDHQGTIEKLILIIFP